MPCLGVVSISDMSIEQTLVDLLGRHDLPSGNDVGERDRLIALPLGHDVGAFDKDHEALVRALVEDLGGACVALHVVGFVGSLVCFGVSFVCGAPVKLIVGLECWLCETCRWRGLKLK